MKKSIIKSMLAVVLFSILTMGTSVLCNAQSKSAAEDLLDMTIKEVNKSFPAEYATGMVCTKLVKEGGYVVYYFTCDETLYDIDLMNKNIPLMHDQILAEMNSDDQDLSFFRSMCKDAGYGIAYYYFGNKSGKIAKVLIPAKELK